MNSPVSSARFEHHIDIRQGGVAAIDWIVGQSRLNHAAATRAVEVGAIWLTRGNTSRLRDCKQLLKYGDQLHLYYDQAIIAMTPLEPELISDFGSYSIWFKPSGMRGEGTRYGDHCSLTRWVEKHFNGERTVELIYRLESTISGLVIISHNATSTTALNAQFLQGQLRNDYRAWVAGLAHFNHQLLDESVRGKKARTLVTTLKQDSEHAQSLLAIRLETGRKHQIRQHLSSVGHPVVGDRVYGNSREDNVQLQLVEVHFICPDTEQWQHIAVPEQYRIDMGNLNLSALSAESA